MADTIPKWASAEISEQLPKVRETGENNKVDFKEDFPEQAHRLGKEIAGMATSGGGRIYLGINDNGDLVGLNVANGDERDDLAERAHSIVRTVKPVPKIVFYFAIETQKTVFVIEITKQDSPVFYYDSRPYVRDERRARPAEPDEVNELVWSHPSSEHKKELERIEQQQMRNIIDSNHQRNSAFDESMNKLRQRVT